MSQRARTKRAIGCAIALGALSVTRVAAADEPEPAAEPAPAPEPAPVPQSAPVPVQSAPVPPPSLTPTVQAPPAVPPKSVFVADPVEDGGAIIIGLTFGLLSNAILQTGEVRPQQISADFTTSQLLWIDRIAVRQTLDPRGEALSNIGLGAIGAYAVLDTVLDGVRTGPSASLVDAVMYVEALTITQGMTNLAKIAFRRPRPIAYKDREEAIRSGVDPATYHNAETDSALSFFSAHTSQAAALASTATYIAFRRSPNSPRPWLTLAGGTALTAFVGYERVRSGAHFPTDVLGGALAGAAVGALVVHLHRAEPKEQRPLWFGLAPERDGGVLSVGGLI